MLSVLRNAKPMCSSWQRMPQMVVYSQNGHQINSIVVKTTRLFGESSRQTARTVRGQTTMRRRTIKEILTAPTTGTPFALGRVAVAGAAALGVTALCYYGIGLSNRAGIYEQSLAWPQYVRDRVHTTYAYFGAGLGITAASAAAVFRSPAAMRLMTKNSIMAILLTMGAMIGTGIVAQSIPYTEGLGAKQLAWAVHCGVVGAVIAPLAVLGGPLVLRAAVYTAGIVGGLSAVAVCAPSDKFLTMGGPLAIGLGVVFAASLGSMFLPPTSAIGASLYTLSIYGGLILFSGFMLYDTQRIVRKAENHPMFAAQPYDPINASISIYLDTINIFVRMLMILSGGGGKRK